MHDSEPVHRLEGAQDIGDQTCCHLRSENSMVAQSSGKAATAEVLANGEQQSIHLDAFVDANTARALSQVLQEYGFVLESKALLFGCQLFG